MSFSTICRTQYTDYVDAVDALWATVALSGFFFSLSAGVVT